MKSALREMFQRPSRLPPIETTKPKPTADGQLPDLEYDTKADRGWRRYFQRPDIQRFLAQRDSVERYRGGGQKCAAPASEKSYMSIDVASMPYLWSNPVTRLNQSHPQPHSPDDSETMSDARTRRSNNGKTTARGGPGAKSTGQSTMSMLSKKGSPRLDDSLEDNPLNRLPDLSLFNKLSYRKLAMATPSTAKLRQREKKFVNDAISTNTGRTRYRDIIPKYDAADDHHCRDYFRRQDVRNLINVTCSLKPGERDVKFTR